MPKAPPQPEQTTSADKPVDPEALKLRAARARMKKERPVLPPLDANGLPPVTRYQKYKETPDSRVACWDLVPATYNPRYMDPYGREGLLKEIRRGIVSRPTWNARKSWCPYPALLGGHQRMSVLAELEGDCPLCQGKKLSPLWKAVRGGVPFDKKKGLWLPPDAALTSPEQCEGCRGSGFKPFSLDLDIVDVTLAEEMRLNVVLNNPSIQGTYDTAQLVEVVEAFHAEVPDLPVGEALAFEPLELQQMGVPEEVLGLFQDPEGVKDAVEELNNIKEIQGLKDAKKKFTKNDKEKRIAEATGQVIFYFEGLDANKQVRRCMVALGYGEHDEPFVPGSRLKYVLQLEDDEEP